MTRTSPSDVEHLAARRQHPHAGQLGSSCRDDARGLLEDVLAGVEDEDRVGVTKARDGARQRVGAAGVDGLRDEADDVGRAAGVRETDVPRASAELALERAGRLEREPALADARRAGQRHEAVLPQELDHLGELRLAADERGRRTPAGCRAAVGAAGTGAIAGSCARIASWRRRSSGPGSSASSSKSTRRASWNTSSASAWRPLR